MRIVSVADQAALEQLQLGLHRRMIAVAFGRIVCVVKFVLDFLAEGRLPATDDKTTSVP